MFIPPCSINLLGNELSSTWDFEIFFSEFLKTSGFFSPWKHFVCEAESSRSISMYVLYHKLTKTLHHTESGRISSTVVSLPFVHTVEG